MATLFTELLADLKADIGDPDGALVPETVVERALIRALSLLNVDAETAYQIAGTGAAREVRPEMTAVHRELLLLRARAMLAGYLQATTSSSNSVSFQSGDKLVDRKTSTTDWSKLESDLLDEYWRRLGKPPSLSSDLLRFDVQPRLYEQGSELE